MACGIFTDNLHVFTSKPTISQEEAERQAQAEGRKSRYYAPGLYTDETIRCPATPVTFEGLKINTEGRTVNVPTDFLPQGKYEVTIYNDDPALNTRTNVRVTTQKIKIGKKAQPLSLPLQPSGGAALHIKPVD